MTSMRDLFPGFYRPTEAEFKQLWEECVFSFDANVLLKLYQFSQPTRETLLNLLGLCKDRLWLTHQAAFEYQRNRHSKINQQIELHNLEKLTAPLESFRDELKKFRHHPLLNYEALCSITNECMERIKTEFEQSDSVDCYQATCEALRDQIDLLFAGKVGLPFSESEQRVREKQAEQRFQNKIPPGYMDVDKAKSEKPERQYGDAILWFQLLEMAKSRKVPVVFVTDDDKEDWWTRQKGKTIGPRPELIAEMLTETGLKFYMYNSEQFLRMAPQFLPEAPQQAAIAEAARELADIRETETQQAQQFLNMVSGGRSFAANPFANTQAVLQRFLNEAYANQATLQTMVQPPLSPEMVQLLEELRKPEEAAKEFSPKTIEDLL